MEQTRVKKLKKIALDELLSFNGDSMDDAKASVNRILSEFDRDELQDFCIWCLAHMIAAENEAAELEKKIEKLLEVVL